MATAHRAELSGASDIVCLLMRPYTLASASNAAVLFELVRFECLVRCKRFQQE